MFRKQALDELNTPEDLERQVALVGPGTMIATGAVIGLALVALAWSVFGRIDFTVGARGTTVAADSFVLRVSAPITGTVVARHVELGDTVEPGAVLATFDTAEIDRSLRTLEARLALLDANLAELAALAPVIAAGGASATAVDGERAQTLAATQQQALRMTLALERADVLARAEKLTVDRTAAVAIRAGRGGSVIRAAIAPGDRVAAGAEMFTIAGDGGHLSAEVFLSPEDAWSVRPGMRAYVRPTDRARGGGTFTGRITAVAAHAVDGSALAHGHGGALGAGSAAAVPVVPAEIAFDDPPPGAPSLSVLRPEEALDVKIVIDERAPIEIVLPSLATARPR